MKLFIPGPVSVRPEVLAKMGMPLVSHRGKEASQLQKSISDKMQRIWHTKEQILLSTSSGSGLMEGAIRSCTKKKAAVFSVGAFGKRWYEMAVENHVPSQLFQVDAGKHTDPGDVDAVLATGAYDLCTITHNETSTGVVNPLTAIAAAVRKYPDVVFCVDMVSSAAGDEVDVDALGIDIAITSTQKCLGLPPGMALCTFSKKAIARAEVVENRGSYLDLLALHKYIVEKDSQYPSTPSLSHMYALEYQLDYILNTEGLENRFARHKAMAEVVKAWGRKYFELLAQEPYCSSTVTTLKNTRNVDIGMLNHQLKQRGKCISNGYGELKEKTFRIAHMADTTMEDIQGVLKDIEEILGL